MSEQFDEGDGLDAFRGLAVACLVMILVWGLVIGAYLLGRAAPDSPSEPVRQAQEPEAPKTQGQ